MGWSCTECHDATIVDSETPEHDAALHLAAVHGIPKGRVYQDARPHYYFDPGCA
jgi:hypothetical protein